MVEASLMELAHMQDLREKETHEALKKCNEQHRAAVEATTKSHFADRGSIVGLLCLARAIRLKAERL